MRGRPHAFPDLCKIPTFKPICDMIARFANNHMPLEDVDSDGFSDLRTFRGTSWRGKDCNDLDGRVYPGRRTTGDALIDTNCNGIYGTDPRTGQTYEELFCSGTQQMGAVILGDSAGAHFHIPPEWVTARNLSVEAFQHLLFIAENELDWPMLSSATGYMNSTWREAAGPVDSTYLRLRSINRCNHRDYQNIAVNGARSQSMNRTIVGGFRRHPTLDNPVFLVLALVGNDVCSGHHDIDHMTKPYEMFANTLDTLRKVDAIVPRGSHVLLMGLVDGRVLYDNLHNRIHPIGLTRNDVNYAQFYDYMNCLYVSPCFGWMNSNATWRNATSERAFALNRVLRDLAKNTTFKNFDVYYFDPPLEQAFAEWRKQGGEPWQLIEPVVRVRWPRRRGPCASCDTGRRGRTVSIRCACLPAARSRRLRHPRAVQLTRAAPCAARRRAQNQFGNWLTTRVSWENIYATVPHIVPAVNPHNAAIEQLFGDQGGY